MAAVLEAFDPRPVVVSAIAALAIHMAIVLALPRVGASAALGVLPRPVDIELAPPPLEPPPPIAPPAIAATGGGGAPAARAPAIVARSEKREDAPSDETLAPADSAEARGGPSRSVVDGGGPPGPPGPPGSASSTLAGVPSPPTAPPAPLPAPVDRSRPPALGRGGEWMCPWPVEAELEQIDEAVVVVAVIVDVTGHASRVEVLRDPGHGFGREARRCAMREVYVPGLDREGRAAVATTKPIRVRFSR